MALSTINQSILTRLTSVSGRVFGTISELVFLLMLILMGKGYTITRGVLSTQSTIVITVFFSAYTVCYAAVFIYEAEVVTVYFSYV